jgi:hypothetical protein
VSVPNLPHSALAAVVTTALLAGGAALAQVPNVQTPAGRSAVDAAVHHYRMSARIRPLLLFWIARDDVGSARLTWLRPDADTFGLELLIGSDPEKAPRRINRWGYLREETGHGATSVVGLMKASDEDSLQAAEDGINHDAADTVHLFKAIRATVTARQSRSVVTLLSVVADPTFRQVGDLLTQLRSSPPSTSERTLDLRPGTRPGFLLSTAELLHDAATAAGRGSVRASDLPNITYVYHGKLYRLRVRGVEPEHDSSRVGAADGGPALRVEIENARVNGEDRSSFTIAFGTEGDLAEVPLAITYRPRWWLEVELTLDDGRAR